ncbi:hypothetical protein TRIATDRAFT_301564 [Trichoderma atroviride IMI 206040]|uniref:Uncharacterized protein n=1 Tax=Hypocrea atroviridis (strain ATCC 20476 / IMI 206040) TaxID=452589 RepID=G9P7G5_HYPAI|nr:uncharacterized protein TRIATDRAFT_301564 [Trichoderma atroviride IMI 206040]EHK40780.1 hypothetical protein TRIATDRAFT_301564 [Trichoderma atroviride IMI 206040]
MASSTALLHISALFSLAPFDSFPFYDHSRPVWLRSAFTVYLILHTSGTILAEPSLNFHNYYWSMNEPV